jgi:hypothetical protein
MLKLTAPDQIHTFTIIYGTRIRKISMWIRKIFTRIRNYFIQTCGSEVPHWYKNMKRYLKNLEGGLLLLHTVRYLIKNARIRIYRYGTDDTLRYRNQFFSFNKLYQGYLRQKIIKIFLS